MGEVASANLAFDVLHLLIATANTDGRLHREIGFAVLRAEIPRSYPSQREGKHDNDTHD
jgi:hypothetical protein